MTYKALQNNLRNIAALDNIKHSQIMMHNMRGIVAAARRSEVILKRVKFLRADGLLRKRYVKGSTFARAAKWFEKEYC